MTADASEFKFYRYNPSIGAAVVFTILFIVASGIHTYQVALTRTWFLIPFVLGGYFEWIGYIGRAISGTESPDFTLNPYILQTLLLLIAPTLYAASIYMELGRIVLITDGEAYCWIRRQWLTKIFLLGDIISFIMQGAGGGIMASGSASALTTGENIIIAGLVIQLLFFSLFVYTSIRFHLGMHRGPSPKVLHSQPPWEKHIYALYAGSLLIFVRCLFRLIEYAQGNDGYLVSHEVFLYIFDGVLMLLVMVVFAWVHPSEINAVLKPGGRVIRRVFYTYSPVGARLPGDLVGAGY
ncbi:RTA1 like protein-domain-containing protein [Aspergillus cavernicola]|uniref:RTA1 like protein-domain-containing protein n=1 Tax=Aspergillus cavernicola TaxID=176166 RepID=A0ABR4I7T2_9EURO